MLKNRINQVIVSVVFPWIVYLYWSSAADKQTFDTPHTILLVTLLIPALLWGAGAVLAAFISACLCAFAILLRSSQLGGIPDISDVLDLCFFIIAGVLVQVLALFKQNLAVDWKSLIRNQFEKQQEKIDAPQLRTLRETVVGIAHIAKHGGWVWANDRYLDILGYSWEELRNKTFQDLTHPEDLAFDVDLANQVWNRLIPSYTIEKRYIKKSGETVWVLLSVSLALTESGEPSHFIANAQDITARRNAEDALKESALQLRLATEAANVGIWDLNVQSGEVRNSDRLWKLLGFDEPLPNFTSEDFLKRIHEEDLPKVSMKLVAATSEKAEFSCEFRFWSGKGKLIWLESVGSPIVDKHGHVVRIVGVNRDITDRKLAQIDFERSVDCTPAILWITDETGHCTYLSRQWYEFTGQTEGEALGFGWIDAVHPGDQEAAREIFLDALRKKVSFQIEYRIRTVTGVYRWAIDAGNVRVDADGNFLGYAGTVLDIHDRKVAEASLEDTAREFQALANSMPQLVWTVNALGQNDYYNERASEYAGLKCRSDGFWDWHDNIHPDDLPGTVKAWEIAVATRTAYNYEHRGLMSSGEYRWHLSRAVPVFQSDGTVKRWIATTTDIHDQKLVAEALSRVSEQAVEASQAKSRFLANMSHEIRSPMTAVLGYAELLLDRGLIEEDRLEYASRIKASGDHLLCIIDDILDLSKVESGEFKVERYQFPVLDLISDCIRSTSVLTNKKNLTMDVEFQTRIPVSIESDPVRFRQILLNLLSNAIKFTEKGGIKIRLSYRGGTDSGESGSSAFFIEVQDSGIGIPPARQLALFKAFSQTGADITRRYGGTGLGLHLSQRLARVLGGDVALMQSTPGEGSLFAMWVDAGDIKDTVLVQSWDDRRVPDKAVDRKIEGPTPLFKVLLAEDSPDNQILIRILLKKLGAAVDTVANGMDALERVGQGDYDIILMDVMMPIMDGLQATRKLREQGYRKPIIALTAHAMKEEIDKCIDAGCDLHLSKPIQMSILEKTLGQFLKGGRDSKAVGWVP